MALDKDLLIGEGDGVVSVVKSFLGAERERYVCSECNVACEETRVHDPGRAAFDGGRSPAWYCGECDSHYVREVSDESHMLDLYGRDTR